MRFICKLISKIKDVSIIQHKLPSTLCICESSQHTKYAHLNTMVINDKDWDQNAKTKKTTTICFTTKSDWKMSRDLRPCFHCRPSVISINAGYFQDNPKTIHLCPCLTVVLKYRTEIKTSNDWQIWPAHVARWSKHSCAICSGWGSNLSPGVSAYQKELFQIISTHIMNRKIIPGRKKGFDGILYKLWPLLTPWLAASRCWPHGYGWSNWTWLAIGWSNTQHQSGLSHTVGHI